MSKTITRKYIQRITKREGNTNIRQSSGGGGGGGGASQYWVEENYISKLFFNQLFTVYDEDGNIVEPNDTESVIASIKSMFGFWTDAYLSALGNGEGGGAELTLASLADVDVHGVANGQALVYDATTQKWVPGHGGGIDITAMWAALAQSGVQQIDASHLATALTGYATETWVGNQGYITGSALNGYATESWVGSQISDMATQTWVSGNYLSQTNAAATYLTQTNAAATYLTKTDAATTYVSIAFFERLFKAYNGSTVVHPNNTTSTIDNIKAMFGFWTEQYISALGNGSGGSSGGITMAQVWSALGNATTEQINATHLTNALSGYNPTSNFKTINGNSIIGTGNITIESSGGTVTAVKVGTTSYSPTDGVVSLPAYPTDADTLDGYHASASNTPFGRIPVITTGGFMDVGNSFEMHYDNSGSLDYSTRLYCTGDYHNSVALPSTTGTLALTSQIPTQVSQLTNDSGFITSSASITGNAGTATKLQTSRTIWGQPFDGSGNVAGNFFLGNGGSVKFYVRTQMSGEDHLHSGFLYDSSGNEAFVFMTGYPTSRIMFYNNTPIDLYEARDYQTKTAALCIYNDSVGIGNNSPAYKLDVDGTFRASGNSIIGGTFGVSGATTLSSTLGVTGNTTLSGTLSVSNAATLSSTLSVTSNTTVGGTLGVTGAATLSSTLSVSGLLTASGGITIPSGKTLTIGDAVLSWDSTNQGIKITKGLYSQTFISALGQGSSGSSGVDMNTVWTALANNTNEQINASHLSTALNPYATQSWVTQQIASVPSSSTAEKLKTARTIWGQSFDGTANVSGWLTGVTGIQIDGYYYTKDNNDSWVSTIDRAPDAGPIFGYGQGRNSIPVYYTGYGIKINGNGVWNGTGGINITTSNNVGIGKGTPEYKLDVDGDVRASSFVMLNGTSSQFLKADGSTDSNSYLPLSGGTMANANLVTNLNAQYLNGYGAFDGSNNGYVFVGAGNYCEMGKHIEFHYDKTSGLDYSTLLQCTGNYHNAVSLPSTSGTLALTTDNVASATKLQTARTIWGQSFDGSGNVTGNLELLQNNKLYVRKVSGQSDYHSGFLYDYGGNEAFVFTTGYTNARMVFYTKLGLDTYATKDFQTRTPDLCLYGNNVGVGTHSPSYKLHVDGTFYASGNSSIGGTFGVSGATTLSSTLGVTGNTTLSGTLSVSKATTLSSTLGVTGAATLSSTLSVTSNTTVGGTLGVTGATTLSSTLVVSDNAKFSGYTGFGYDADTNYRVKVKGVAYASTGVYSGGYVTALSDIRHKDVKGNVRLTVKEIANAPSVKFLWKDRRQEGMQVGSIAQYWKKVMPEAIVENADGELTMSYGVIALLASIATARKVEDHERRIAELERENKLLKEQLNAA